MDDYAPFLADVRRRLNRISPLADEEAEVVLNLAAAAAHKSERRFAPLTCYLAGLAIGDRPLNDRLVLLQELIEFIEGDEPATSGS